MFLVLPFLSPFDLDLKVLEVALTPVLLKDLLINFFFAFLLTKSIHKGDFTLLPKQKLFLNIILPPFLLLSFECFLILVESGLLDLLLRLIFKFLLLIGLDLNFMLSVLIITLSSLQEFLLFLNLLFLAASCGLIACSSSTTDHARLLLIELKSLEIFLGLDFLVLLYFLILLITQFLEVFNPFFVLLFVSRLYLDIIDFIFSGLFVPFKLYSFDLTLFLLVWCFTRLLLDFNFLLDLDRDLESDDLFKLSLSSISEYCFSLILTFCILFLVFCFSFSVSNEKRLVFILFLF